MALKEVGGTPWDKGVGCGGVSEGLVRIGTREIPTKLAKALEPKDWGEYVGSVHSAEKSANFTRLAVGGVEGVLPVPSRPKLRLENNF